jgi:hypothetical protein
VHSSGQLTVSLAERETDRQTERETDKTSKQFRAFFSDKEA